MNSENLRRIAERIDEEPKTFNMEVYADETSCGTTMCVAGHAVALSNPQLLAGYMVGTCGIVAGDLVVEAADFLDIPSQEAHHFFHFSHLDYGMEWVQAHAENGKVATALRWMADNNCPDWQKAGAAAGFTPYSEWQEDRQAAYL